MSAKKPRPASQFRLTLGGEESVGLFREVSGIDSEIETTELKAKKPTNLVLKRGVAEGDELRKWREAAVKKGPDAARVDGTLELLDETGTVVATYGFRQGWPIKYSAPSFNAASNEVAIEELHITHEGLEPV